MGLGDKSGGYGVGAILFVCRMMCGMVTECDEERGGGGGRMEMVIQH